MRLALLFLAAGLPVLHGATEWLKIASPNFELYTTAGEKDARRTLEYFEQVRDFFIRVKSQEVTTRLPVTIVVFRNQKEYKPYSPREGAAAFFIGDEQRDYIVMGGTGQEHYPTAVHEYMHLLIRHSGLKISPWLNEGIAEVYSTLAPLGGKILVGSVPRGSGYSLGEQKWLPVDAMLRVTHDSPEYNEKDRTGLFYAQSWLLTHMMMLDPAYSKAFGKFLVDTSNSGSAEGAFQRVYAKTVADVDKDLRAYYRSNSLKGALFDTRLQKIEVGDPRPATELETGLTLAKLTGLLRRREEASRRFEELAKAYPDNWEIHEAIGHLSWQEGDLAKAKASLKRAVELKPASWKTYWDYARLAQGEPGVVDSLRSALRINPELVDARMMLGFELYRAKNYKDALDTLSPIKRVTPERAPSFFLVKAYCAMHTGNKTEARTWAESGKKYAKTPTDIAQADSILEYLDRSAQAGTERMIAPSHETAKAEENLSVVRGVLEQIDCFVNKARIHLVANSTRMSLLIRDPDTVKLKNADSSSVNVTCGPQKNTRVIIEYRPKDDAELKTSGDIVSMEFTERPAAQ